MGRLAVLLLLALPVLELWLLVRLGARIGLLPTLGLLVATAVLGAALARAEGARVLGQVQRALAEGRAPDRALLGGLMVFFGGVLLVVPGLVSDALGLVLLFPPTRALLARLAERQFARAVAGGGVVIQFGGLWPGGVSTRRDPLDDEIIDVEAEDVTRPPAALPQVDARRAEPEPGPESGPRPTPTPTPTPTDEKKN